MELITIAIISAVALILIVWAIVVYNKLVKKKILVEEAWSIIDVFLKKRYDLVPNLVASVKGYAAHEKETLENVALARSAAMNAKDLASRIDSENALGNVLGQLIVVAEKYPDLRASENFMYLQKELSKLENELERARRYYNGTVREMNIAIQMFPSNIIASIFRFKKCVFFKTSNDESEVPQISM